MKNDIRVIFPVAGQGSRLRPITDDKPKCMVAFNGKPLLEYQLDIMNQMGIEDIILVGGYRADKLPGGYKKYLNPDYAATNMVFSLFCALAEMQDDKDLVVAYGDIIYEKKVLEQLLKSNKDVSVVTDIKWKRCWDIRNEDVLSDAETFKWDPDTGKIVELGKKAHSLDEIQGQYTGLIKIHKRFVTRFKEFYLEKLDRSIKYDGNDFNNMYMTSLIQELINDNQNVFGVPVENGWLEFDTVSDITLYEEMLGNNTLGSLFKL